MVKTEVDRIYISVMDINKSLKFYRDYVGMKVIAEQDLDTKKIQELWTLPEGTKARVVSLNKEETPTILELVQFQPNPGKTIRGGSQQWDYGIYDIAFSVRDTEKIYQDLMKMGYKCVSPPIYFAPDWIPFDVKEFVLIGPDDVMISHIEITTDPKPEIKGDYGMLLHSAWMIENVNEEINFFRDVVGLNLIMDHKIPRGVIDEVLTLPPKTDSRMAYFNQETGLSKSFGRIETTGIELLEFSVKGKYLDSVPPNLGIFMVSFETNDLSGLIDKLKKEEFRILSGPIEIDAAPHGKAKTITVEGPTKEIVGFIEK